MKNRTATFTVSLTLLLLSLVYCRPQTSSADMPAAATTPSGKEQDIRTIDTAGAILCSRFPAPAGYERDQPVPGTFGYYLQHLPLRPHGTPVRLFDGTLKARQHTHAAVLDLETGNRNLQQCADAVIRLRAEYLWQTERYDQIGFHFTNGFFAPYARWRNGERIRVEGNEVSWYATGRVSRSYATFRKYLAMIFAYAGTISLNAELNERALANIQIGDVFVEAGSPGHAVIVVDRAVAPESGEIVFLLAQSYMPAQDIHLLVNPGNVRLSPWYALNEIQEKLVTPEWTFSPPVLKQF